MRSKHTYSEMKILKIKENGVAYPQCGKINYRHWAPFFLPKSVSKLRFYKQKNNVKYLSVPLLFLWNFFYRIFLFAYIMLRPRNMYWFFAWCNAYFPRKFSHLQRIQSTTFRSDCRIFVFKCDTFRNRIFTAVLME